METASFVQDGQEDLNLGSKEEEKPSNIVTLPFAAASQISLADTSAVDTDQDEADSIITSFEELEEEATIVVSEDDVTDQSEQSGTDDIRVADDNQTTEIGFVFDKDGGPYHFVWESDEIGRFSFISKDLADAVGPNHAAIVGQSWDDLANKLNMDADGQIATAFAARDTWTGLTVNWPVQDSDVAVPVELTGLPVFGRFHGFQGFRGFGICRTHLAVPFSSDNVEPIVSPEVDDEPAAENNDTASSSETLSYDDPLLSDDLMIAADLAVKTAGAVVSGSEFDEDPVDKSSDDEATQKVAAAMQDLLEEEVSSSITEIEGSEVATDLDDDLAAQHAIEGNEVSTPAVLSMTDTDDDLDHETQTDSDLEEDDLSHLSKSEQDAFDQIAEALVEEEEERQDQSEELADKVAEEIIDQNDPVPQENSDGDDDSNAPLLLVAAGAATAMGINLSLDEKETDVSETSDESSAQVSEELTAQTEKKNKKEKKKHKAAKTDTSDAGDEVQDQDAPANEADVESELRKAEKKRLKAEKKRRKEEKKLKAKKLKKARKRKKARKAARLAMLQEKENTSLTDDDRSDADIPSSGDGKEHDSDLVGKAAMTATAAGLLGIVAASDDTTAEDTISQDGDASVVSTDTVSESLEDEASLSQELASAQANTSIASPEDEASSYQSSNLEEAHEEEDQDKSVYGNDADIIEASIETADEMIAADAPSVAPIEDLETSSDEPTDLSLSDDAPSEQGEEVTDVEDLEVDESLSEAEPSESEITDETTSASDDDALKSAASIAFRDILAMDPAFRHLHGSKSGSAESDEDAGKEAMRRRNKSGPRFEALLGGLDQGDDAKAELSEPAPEETISASDDSGDSVETPETVEETADTSNIVSLTDQGTDLSESDDTNDNLVDLFADHSASKTDPIHDVIDLASHATSLNDDNGPNEPLEEAIEADEPVELNVAKLAQANTSSEVLASILDKVPAALIVSANQSTLYAHSKALSLLGFESQDAFEAAGGMEALFGGRPGDWLTKTEGLTTLRKQDGAPLSAEAKVSSIQWNGEAAAMLCFEEAKTEAPSIGLSEEDEKIAELEAILDTATDGVVVLDSRAGILRMNHSAEALFEVDRHEMAGESFLDLLAEESHKDAIDYLDGLMANGVASVLNDGREVIGRVSSGGLIPLFMTMGRVAIPGTNRFCAVVRDIAQWKRAEEDLLAEKRRAEKANSQKSDFLAKISHEIRTPLNAIIGFSEVMMDERFGSVGNERYKDYLKDIHTSGSHIMSLINDLLDLSKVEAGKMDLSFQATELNALIQESVGLMQPQANREQIIIRTSLASNLPDVVGDARSLRQIILNLLSNGVKYTPAGGQVIISTSYEENGEVILRIRDTGIGMSEEEVKTALEPFRQVSSTASKGGPGTGLGLPLTKALVEANRAQFSLVSAKDHGTLVEITFPNARVLAS
jgi:PAS domain S-box-containing protein